MYTMRRTILALPFLIGAAIALVGMTPPHNVQVAGVFLLIALL